mmetsp:Transcript_62460/g.103908  ORF Transcript_62460/g.103908 Transcript_62460/m.103908 type:complete len:177 (+) Transcript_62460:15-545(+)|eukprot:CAMPEP_0119342696 /NCGR_PEP_ID=MMETSP1333-20130426/105254_1 /TAXON_ID=418940 /ORGANISM="Scyphosphaera apsteinii, Strain RCC1455" /LENGTH=176 /DNA_ID=CAMNT_0007354973 /DNA_START=10 /DNA_END=540 /DNA_ORIENTATION=-
MLRLVGRSVRTAQELLRLSNLRLLHPFSQVTRWCGTHSAGGSKINATAKLDGAAVFAPSHSRAARRERLQTALAAAARGEDFVIPVAEPRLIPGPVGAVMNVLRDMGPQTTEAIFKAVEQRYPGAVKSQSHLKSKILAVQLVNKVMKVRATEDAKYKDHWAIRRRGQVRMKSARKK